MYGAALTVNNTAWTELSTELMRKHKTGWMADLPVSEGRKHTTHYTTTGVISKDSRVTYGGGVHSGWYIRLWGLRGNTQSSSFSSWGYWSPGSKEWLIYGLGSSPLGCFGTWYRVTQPSVYTSLKYFNLEN